MKISELKYQIYINRKKLESFNRYKNNNFNTGDFIVIKKDKNYIEFSERWIVTEIINKNKLLKKSKL